MSQTRLFVGNLPNNVEEKDLLSSFSSYGEVINLDIKCKSESENDPKKFAFITISSSNNAVEACIKHFGGTDFKGRRLYVTRARESFLERLQRERQQAGKKDAEKENLKEIAKKNPVIKLGDKLNPKKRKIESNNQSNSIHPNKNLNVIKEYERHLSLDNAPGDVAESKIKHMTVAEQKKHESDKKRMESMQKKRQEFKDKQKIIKTGLIAIDNVPNKKIIFSDNEGDISSSTSNKNQIKIKSPKSQSKKKNTLFDDEESDDDVNFEIKEQYEGKKGQKVLDLQSRYKSDKRFVLDERFIEDDQTDNENEKEQTRENCGEQTLTEGEEKSKQIKILEDVLGVAIKSHINRPEKDRKMKPNMGMIRFDPMNPQHAKFVVPIEEVKHESKKSKKVKTKDVTEPEKHVTTEPKIVVSQEQFYKSEITKEAFEQPAAGFSLRSLFGANNNEAIGPQEQSTEYIPLQQKAAKAKNPLELREKNPFIYDSSESEGEDDKVDKKDEQAKDLAVPEVKAVWKENLFFSVDDSRFKDGLAFFNMVDSNEMHKERRGLKFVMKKRIHNTERKNQMFKKKIGGRKKTMKKSFKKKS